MLARAGGIFAGASKKGEGEFLKKTLTTGLGDATAKGDGHFNWGFRRSV